MKTKTKKLAILIVIGLLFPLILNYNFNFSSNFIPTIENPKISGTYNGIFIDDTLMNNGTSWGNWTWARTQPWCTKGNGTKGNPYVIEDSIFLSAGPSDCLLIQHSIKYFIVQNCTFKDIPVASFAGLRLNNVTNGQIVDNRAYNNSFGIYLYDCHDNIIKGNIVYNNIYYGIYLQGEPFIRGCYNNTILGNTANNNTLHGIALIYNCDYNNLTGNTANDNGASGILLDGQDGGTCYKNIVSGNTAINNTQDGIHLRWDCYNNTISGNTVNNNSQNGIYLIYYCDYNNITGNTANGNVNGINLHENCNNNTLTENTIFDNSDGGIYLHVKCHQNNIVDNTVNNNKWGIYLNYYSTIADQCTHNRIINNTANNNIEKGIYIHICDYNNISGNIVNDNGYQGIFIEGGSNFNNVINNTAKRNGIAGISIYNGANDNTLIHNIATENTKYGMELYHSDNTKIINNTVNHNGAIGIYIHFAFADYNTITGNTINDNAQIGIYILDRCDNNNIKNNTINRNNLGIGIKENSNDNTISDNILIDNAMCIFELECTGNIIENNTCFGSYKELPIFINGSATGVGAHNWTWAESQPWCSGLGTESQPYIIENITRDGFAITNAIEIINSNVHFNVINCTFYNSESGIKLENVINGTLIENNCFLNFVGINLGSNCDFNNITGNMATNNDNTGIVLGNDCDFNIIIENTVNNNTYSGIFLQDLCDNNTISHNIALYNGVTGIFLSGGDRDSSYNNTFLANTIDNNEYGIQLEGDCHFNVISGNIIKSNNFGIKFDTGCSNNTVYNNLFLKNGKHAIDDGADNYWNSTTIGNLWDNWTGPDESPIDGIVDIPYNISGSAGSKDYLPIADENPPIIIINSPVNDDLFGSSPPVYDVNITDNYLDVMWYTLDGGLNNYTFTEFTGIIDQNVWNALTDGLIKLTFYASDKPGNIGTAEVTIEKDTTGPIIGINSPSSGSEFGANAPDFIITVTDDHLDSMWYSLDGGLTTYAITTNSTINQVAWAALSEGSITITFYANDTLGNVSFEEITITKYIPPEEFDPTIIIVVVSIIGGIAVVAGIYIFMKKRVTPE